MKIRLLGVVSACALSLVFVSADAASTGDEDSKIVWSCKAQYGTENVLWLVEWGPKSYVKVFDERIPAKLSLAGLEKRWDWGFDTSDSSYNYAVALDSNRTAAYYDFSPSKDGKAKARQLYKCTKWSKEIEEEKQRQATAKKRRAAMQRTIDDYVRNMQEKVQRSWIRPSSSGDELSCTVEVRLIPSGEVIDAQIVRSSGNAAFDRSVEAAVFNASPLPVPQDRDVMDQFRTLRFQFKPE